MSAVKRHKCELLGSETTKVSHIRSRRCWCGAEVWVAWWVSSAWVVHRVWGESGRLILRGYAQIAGRTHPTLGHRLWQGIQKQAATSCTGARPQPHKRGHAAHRVLGFGRRPICAYPRSMRPPPQAQNPPPQPQREDSLTPESDTKQRHKLKPKTAPCADPAAHSFAPCPWCCAAVLKPQSSAWEF